MQIYKHRTAARKKANQPNVSDSEGINRGKFKDVVLARCRMQFDDNSDKEKKKKEGYYEFLLILSIGKLKQITKNYDTSS
jgi:hypothetical protein